MKNDIKNIKNLIEDNKKIETLKEKEKREEREKEQLIKGCLDTFFFSELEQQENVSLVTFEKNILLKKYDIIENLALKLEKSLIIEENDELTEKRVVKIKYNLTINEIKEKMEIYFYQILKKVIDEKKRILELEKKENKEELIKKEDLIFNYLVSLIEVEKKESNIVMIIPLLKKETFKKAFFEDVKKFFKVNIDDNFYNKLLKKLNDNYKIEIELDKRKIKILEQEQKRKNNIINRQPFFFKLAIILKGIKHLMKK